MQLIYFCICHRSFSRFFSCRKETKARIRFRPKKIQPYGSCTFLIPVFLPLCPMRFLYLVTTFFTVFLLAWIVFDFYQMTPLPSNASLNAWPAVPNTFASEAWEIGYQSGAASGSVTGETTPLPQSLNVFRAPLARLGVSRLPSFFGTPRLATRSTTPRIALFR